MHAPSKPPPEREFAFLLNDVARLLRTCADQRAGAFGMSRAQWAVLARLERCQGLKQGELAEMLDIQPITLTRLVDRLCDSGLIERRPDRDDRRAKRLFLTAAAAPVMQRLNDLGRDLMADVLAGLPADDIERLNGTLATIKKNLRTALQNRTSAPTERTSHG
jgi:MarR family transcriptional regulator for hemolysin